MRSLKFIHIVISIVVICSAALAASVVNAQESEEAEFQQFIGTVTGEEDIFVGLAILDGEATIYICDGQAALGLVSIAEWFVGPVVDNTINITADSGNTVEVTIAGDTATGKFTFTDGSVKEFVLHLPEGNSGLFRSDFSLGELDYIGGWLVLPDGSVRGAISQQDTSTLFPATLESFGQFIPDDED